MRSKCCVVISSLIVVTVIDQEAWAGAPEPDYPFRNAGSLRVFYSLDDVKSVFQSPEFNNMSSCRMILDVFHRDCCPFGRQYIKTQWEPSKYPFIVFEGNHRVSTSVVSKMFAKTLMATHSSMSPPCLIPYRKLFSTDNLLLRRAFFSLGVYVLGYQAAESIHRWPVVVTSYWNHQEIFALTKLMNGSNLPEKGSPIYSMWPKDLLKPDLLFYINFPDNVHGEPATTRKPESWKPRLLEFYRNLDQPITIEINTMNGWNEALSEIQEHVLRLLGSTKIIEFRNVTFKEGRRKVPRPKKFNIPIK